MDAKHEGFVRLARKVLQAALSDAKLGRVDRDELVWSRGYDPESPYVREARQFLTTPSPLLTLWAAWCGLTADAVIRDALDRLAEVEAYESRTTLKS